MRFRHLLNIKLMGNKQEKNNIPKLRTAADQGHAKSQYNLGLCYFHGIGVEKNEVIDVELY